MMKKNTSLLLAVLLINSLNSFSQTPLTDENIHTAVFLWFSDATTAEAVYGHINDWDTSSVTNMQSLFSNRRDFTDIDITNWDVSNVTNMNAMFIDSYFDQPIGNWDVSNVKSMKNMFEFSPFDQDISNWDVSSVANMFEMFFYSSFNQPIENWDVSSVISMSAMFWGSPFNQPLGNWDISNISDLGEMFAGASSFNQDISNWDVGNVKNMSNMFSGATSFSMENYDKLLISWAEKSLQSNVIMDANTSYCKGEAARASILYTYKWIINDNGKDCSTLSTESFLLNSFSFHPNPTTSSVKINSIISSNYTLYSLIGKKVKIGALIVGKNDIDLSNYANGTYLLKINSNHGSTTKRIVKH